MSLKTPSKNGECEVGIPTTYEFPKPKKQKPQFKYILDKQMLEIYKVPVIIVKFLTKVGLFKHFQLVDKEQYKQSKAEDKLCIYVKLKENNHIVKCNKQGAAIIINNEAGELSTRKAFQAQKLEQRKREKSIL